MPTWARVAHLAFFTHGSRANQTDWGGLQTANDWGGDGVMHMQDLEGFARTLTAFCTNDVKVSMFSCSTGAEYNEEDASNQWRPLDDARGGEGSFADNMADALADAGAKDARVLGHTTSGPTVNNPFARLFGGGEEGGVNLFNWVMLPLSDWFGPELAKARAVQPDADAVLKQTLFEWFRVLLNNHELSQVASRMNGDPELFRAEMRLRAKAYAQNNYSNADSDWSGTPGGTVVRSKRADAVYPAYKVDPVQMVQIPPFAPLTIQGPPERVKGFDSYPITWDGDPREKQAYLKKDWVDFQPAR